MEYDYHLWLSIIIFIATAVMMFWGKFSMGSIALTSMMLFIFTGCLEGSTALAGFSNSSTIILGSMYVISAAFNNTSLPGKISGLVNKISKGSYLKVLVGMCLVTFLIGQFVPSSTGVFCICFPVALALCNALNFPKKAMIWSIGIIAIATGSALPIGSSAISYIEWNALLESYDYTVYLADFMSKFINRLPATIIVLVYCIFLAPKMISDRKDLAVQADASQKKTEKKQHHLTPLQDTLGTVIFFGVILAMMTFQLHNIDLWKVCLCGAILMVMSGILTPNELYLSFNMGGGMIFVNVGMLAMGSALSNTGAAAMMGDQVVKMLGSHPSNLGISAAFMGATTFVTQFIMNSPVRNVFNQVAIMTAKQMQCDPIGLLGNVYMGANLSFLLPSACATVPIMMGAGDFKVKDLIKYGLPLAILCVIATTVWVAFVQPAFH